MSDAHCERESGRPTQHTMQRARRDWHPAPHTFFSTKRIVELAKSAFAFDTATIALESMADDYAPHRGAASAEVRGQPIARLHLSKHVGDHSFGYREPAQAWPVEEFSSALQVTR